MQRKKTRSRIITGTMLIVMLLSLTGCFGSSDSAEMKAGALEYLENKYNESFEIISYTDPNWSENFYDYMVIPLAGDYKGEEFEVIGKDYSGKIEYIDTYINLIKHDEFIEKLQNLADSYFENALVYGEIESLYGNEFTKDMSIDDAAGIVTGSIDILVPKDSISKEDYDKACCAIKETLDKEECNINLKIMSLVCDISEVSTEEKYDALLESTQDKSTLLQWDFWECTGD